MPHSNLLDALSDQAKAEREKVLAAAREKAEAIIKAAIEGVQEKPEEPPVSSVKAETATEGETTAGESEGEVKEAKEVKPENAPLLRQEKFSRVVLQAQHEFYLQAIETAKKSLVKVRGREDYPQILGKLIQEAVADFPAAARILVRSQDADKVAEILAELNVKLEVVANPNAPVGIVVASQDGKLVRYNTLDSRLERALPHLSTQIAQVLYG